MGVTTDDIVGVSAVAQPAHPATYGDAPSSVRLPDATHLGQVRLQVERLARNAAAATRAAVGASAGGPRWAGPGVGHVQLHVGGRARAATRW